MVLLAFLIDFKMFRERQMQMHLFKARSHCPKVAQTHGSRTKSSLSRHISDFYQYFWRGTDVRRIALYAIPGFGQLMMTSSNGTIFRVTGHLCGEFTGPGEFLAQRPVTRSFDVFFDLRLNKRLSKQSWGWWFETLSCSLWRHRNVKTRLRVRVYAVLRCSSYVIF